MDRSPYPDAVFVNATKPLDDSDGDGLPDYLESQGCTDPYDADTDDDGISDGVEDANHNGRVDPGELNPNIRDSRAMPWLQLLLLGD